PESRAKVTNEGRSGVDAFVGVLEEDAQGGGHRNRHEQTQDAAKIAAYHEGDDDQHWAEMDGIAEDLRRDEVVDDVRDHEVDDEDDDHLGGGLGDEGGHRDRGQGPEERTDEWNEGGHAGHDAQRQRVGNADDPHRHPGDQPDERADRQLTAHVG